MHGDFGSGMLRGWLLFGGLELMGLVAMGVLIAALGMASERVRLAELQSRWRLAWLPAMRLSLRRGAGPIL